MAVAPPQGLLERISKCGKCKSKAIQAVVLSCLHSCCSECVNGLLKDSKDGIIVCLRCEKAVTAEGENSFMEALSQVFTPDENVPKCQICKAEKIDCNATQVCLHCPPPSHYCDECTSWHKRFPNSKTHRQVTLSDFMERGGIHPHNFPVSMCACCSKAKAEVSCRGCVLSLCLKCGVARSCSKGGKHDIEDESTAVDHYRQEIQKEMDIFKQNADDMSEPIQETRARLADVEEENMDSVFNLKEHHSTLLKEMETQEDRLRELGQNNSVEIVIAFSQMTEAREANIRGEKSGQRALDFAPEGLMGAALAEVKVIPRPSPPTPDLVKTEITFARPNTASVANQGKHVLGSIIYNKVIKSWPGKIQPWICCAVALPSGKDVIFETAGADGLYMIDHQTGTRIKLHDGDTAGIYYSHTDQKVYAAVRLSYRNVSILSYDLVAFDGTGKPTTEVSDAGCTRCQGIAMSSSGKIALADYSQKCVLILNEHRQIVQKVGFVNMGVNSSKGLEGSQPLHLSFGSTDTDMYITVIKDTKDGQKQFVVCLFIDYDRERNSVTSMSKPQVRWVREMCEVFYIQYMNGAVYVFGWDSISVLDPSSGNSLMTVVLGGLLTGIRSLPNGVVEVVSYETCTK